VEADAAARSQFNVAEQTFAAAGKNGDSADAFEQYIRGITEPDQAERLRTCKMR
jgi:hypothetical protein